MYGDVVGITLNPDLTTSSLSLAILPLAKSRDSVGFRKPAGGETIAGEAIVGFHQQE